MEEATQSLKANTMVRAKELARLANAKQVDAKKARHLLKVFMASRSWPC